MAAAPSGLPARVCSCLTRGASTWNSSWLRTLSWALKLAELRLEGDGILEHLLLDGEIAAHHRRRQGGQLRVDPAEGDEVGQHGAVVLGSAQVGEQAGVEDRPVLKGLTGRHETGSRARRTARTTEQAREHGWSLRAKRVKASRRESAVFQSGKRRLLRSSARRLPGLPWRQSFTATRVPFGYEEGPVIDRRLSARWIAVGEPGA